MFHNLLSCVFAATLACGAFPEFPEDIAPDTSVHAKDIFFARPQASSLPLNSVSLALQYKILLKRGDDVTFVPPHFSFQSGDKFRVFFQANQSGYAHLLNRGNGGDLRVLFPCTEINGGSNKVPALIEYSIPSAGWYEFDQRPGQEELLVLFSVKPLESLKGARSGETISPQTFRDTIAPAIAERNATQRQDRDSGFRDVIYVDSLDAPATRTETAGPMPSASVSVSPAFAQSAQPVVGGSTQQEPPPMAGVATSAIVPAAYASCVVHERQPFLVACLRLQHR